MEKSDKSKKGGGTGEGRRKNLKRWVGSKNNNTLCKWKITYKVAVHPLGPRKHCVISAYIFNEKSRVRLGKNNSPVLHSTGFIRRLRVTELLWSAWTHGKALPSNAERRVGRFVQCDGGSYAF